jgi:DNA-binding MarR family transcriptional regulator
VNDRIRTLHALEQEVGVLMRRVRRALAERAVLVHPSLQPSSYVMLAHLIEAGPRRSADIAEKFDLDKGAVSRQVQHLVELGLVERTPDPADGRATILTATDEARERMDAVSRKRIVELDARLADWTSEDLEELVARFSRYNRTLDHH